MDKKLNWVIVLLIINMVCSVSWAAAVGAEVIAQVQSGQIVLYDAILVKGK